MRQHILMRLKKLRPAFRLRCRPRRPGYWIFLGALVWLTCALPPWQRREDDPRQTPDQTVGDPLYRALDKLTNQLVSGIEAQNKKTLAVIEFSNLDGSVSAFGRFFAEKLISKLFETRRFNVIERNLLNKVIEEYQLSQTGVTTPELAEQLGKLLGVDAIITGTITDMGSGFDINSRIIDTRTGGLMSAASVLVIKDEMVLKLLETDDHEPGVIPKPEAPEATRLPSGAFTSAVEVDTKVLIKLDPVYELARKTHAVKLVGNRLIWENMGTRNDVAYVHKNGKIIVLSEQPLSSQEDMEEFRSIYVRIIDFIIKVNIDMNKSIRNRAWENAITVYNYERNTYKRLSGYLRGAARVRVPKMNVKQITLFVFSDGYNNRVFMDAQRLAQWNGRGSRNLEVTHYLYYGDHTLEIKLYGGTRPYFIFEFFVESTTQNVTLTNDGDLNLQDSVPCYSISDLVLPN